MFADSKGAVVFVGGGHTNTIYARNSNELHAGGYETYLLVYRGELGYFTDSIGAGLKDISCGTSEIIKYIASDLADNPEVMGATGVSAGSMQLGFGLTVYGLEEILDVVLLDSGPVHADMVSAYFDFSTPARGRILDYAHDWFGKGDYCQVGSGPESFIPILKA